MECVSQMQDAHGDQLNLKVQRMLAFMLQIMGHKMNLPTNKQNMTISVLNGQKRNIVKQNLMRFNSCLQTTAKICRMYSLRYQVGQEITILQITAPTCLTKISKVTQNFSLPYLKKQVFEISISSMTFLCFGDIASPRIFLPIFTKQC